MFSQRRSIRLSGYDYSSAGFYYVTICVQGKESLLGEIAAGEMLLNDAGRMVGQVWCEIINKFPSVELDHYVVMPNHFHGILFFNDQFRNQPTVGADLCVCPGLNTDPNSKDASGHKGPKNPGGHKGPKDLGGHAGPKDLGGHIGPENVGGHIGPPLPRVIQWFKTMTTNAYINGVKNNNWSPFAGRFWQRNYYERIIRNENELNNIRQYIDDNPQKWEQDTENPINPP